MVMYHYQLSHLDEIYALSVDLAHYFPKAEDVQIGIYELLLNALEHGNLAINEAQKLQLVRENCWQQEVMRRLALTEYRDKHVAVALEVDEDGCRITITDQGEGFDWRSYMHRIEPPREQRSGLGLLMVRHAGFDAIAFNEKGNEVRCAVRARC